MKKTILFAMMAVCSMNMQAQFSGKGSGTEKDPYQITNADELFEVRNDLEAYYKQINDIDLTAWIQEDNPVKGWNPIGNINTPFMGHYDGNFKIIKGLKISQPNSDKIGFFGAIQGASIKNLSFLNANIVGKNEVGGLVGFVDVRFNEDISNIVFIGGSIIGQSCVGGIAGRIGLNHYEYCDVTTHVNSCFSSSLISGTNGVGGIVGSASGWDYRYEERYLLYLTDNCFYGTVTALDGFAGGIWGQEESVRMNWGGYRNFHCLRNIAGGVIKASKEASGIWGYVLYENNGTKDMKNNVCLADTVSSFEDKSFFISSIEFLNNYGLTTTVFYSRGKVVDSGSDGETIASYGRKTLQKESTYAGMEFDFSKKWAIIEGESFPYNINQCSPGTITEFVCGSRAKICGTAIGTGKVYVFVGNDLYESYVLDGKWEVTLGNIAKGTEAKVAVATEGLMPSLLVSAFAQESSVTPTVLAGDANGDGVVDSADVTAIINFILGKPSTSFNKENADVTGDGEILIDDAVQTVQMIMDAQ